MSRIRFIVVIVALGALGGIIKQRSAIAGLREQNEILRTAQEEVAKLKSENAGLPTLRSSLTNQLSSTSNDSKLLRLRGEVSRLRVQRAEQNRLYQKNAQLAEQIRIGVALPQKISEMEGFVAREAWANAGFASPEAALQTFFWAAREGNLTRLADCFPGKDGQHLAALNQPGLERERDKVLNDLQQMTSSEGFRIVEKVIQEEGFQTRRGEQPTGSEPRIPTKALLRVQAVTGGAVWAVSLRLHADGWKLKEF